MSQWVGISRGMPLAREEANLSSQKEEKIEKESHSLQK